MSRASIRTVGLSLATAVVLSTTSQGFQPDEPGRLPLHDRGNRATMKREERASTPIRATTYKYDAAAIAARPVAKISSHYVLLQLSDAAQTHSASCTFAASTACNSGERRHPPDDQRFGQRFRRADCLVKELTGSLPARRTATRAS